VENTDNDPCNNYGWSIAYLFIFCLALIAMIAHVLALWKKIYNHNR